jgi:hypothetical protein
MGPVQPVPQMPFSLLQSYVDHQQEIVMKQKGVAAQVLTVLLIHSHLQERSAVQQLETVMWQKRVMDQLLLVQMTFSNLWELYVELH